MQAIPQRTKRGGTAVRPGRTGGGGVPEADRSLFGDLRPSFGAECHHPHEKVRLRGERGFGVRGVDGKAVRDPRRSRVHGVDRQVDRRRRRHDCRTRVRQLRFDEHHKEHFG